MENKDYVLITGASSGIGREAAVLLSHHYNLIINGRNDERLNETLMLCENSNNHLIWLYDLGEISNIEGELSKFMMEKGIYITHFVHSAGYMKAVPLKMVSVDNMHQVFNTNIISAALIVKVLTKKKINGNFLKSVVFISSNISNFGAKAFSIYAASKSGLDGLMRCLAVELAPNVRVNSVLPGGVRTAMTEHMYQDNELIERMATSYPLGLGNTKDIASAVAFLLSEESRWITGQQLTVDGGRTINITG